MSKNRKRNKKDFVNRLMSKGLVFGALMMLFVATIASAGVAAVAGMDKSELLVSIKGFPFLSPDWKKVAFCGSEDMNYTLYVINSDGSGLKRLTDEPSRICGWSPDSEKILYSTAPPSGMKKFDIWVINQDGSNKKKITELYLAEIDTMIWSPDGSKIAFPRWDEYPSYPKIFVMNSDGSDEKLITGGVLLGWTPDGKKIIFLGERENLWEIDLDSGVLKSLTNITFHGRGRGIEISPDGSEIAFEYYGIWIVKSDGSNRKQISQSEYDILLGRSWSPDGKRIAFFSEEKGIRSGFWIMNSDGSDQKKIVELPEKFAGWMGWSQDGSKIAYATYGEGSTPTKMIVNIYTINVGKPSPVKPPTGETPTEKQLGIPGFEAVFAIAGLLAVTYLLRRRK